ncbi:peptidyl-prolyl cis-trans isomerase CWC27 homolog isoform X2 [Acanthaster planci]|uniref:Spliceosome-associated protein CWC27 homolog n=1 Tax=Acanthaster planci TaxID=133434 RepID=A0A8B7ZB20_ACAPL|nr:peptidyl-prolyl cis-trans isomerase CWC27 homolog isoform X2 [Acanthaster planci]
MSATYILEPPTNGKVLLRTTCGDIDVELWSKETPKACRNFIQLCREGYYDGTIFHRIIKGFMAQGGDPTGTGEGGESVYGHPFKDEFHSRLKFARRGLLAMANAGPNDNGSQFFLTFDRCDHLNNKHTIFGKVLSNPFDDIVPRQLKKETEKEVRKKSKSKATKNFSLLSFGEEAEEDEEEVNEASLKIKQKHKSKSAHDLGNDPNLSSVAAVNVEKPKPTLPSDDVIEEIEEEKQVSHEDVKESIRKKLKKSSEKPVQKLHEEADDGQSRRSEMQKESDQLTRESHVRETKRRDSDARLQDKDERKKSDEEEAEIQQKEAVSASPVSNDMMSEFRQQKKKFRQMKKNQAVGGNREDQTLAILAKFQNSLHQANQEEKNDGNTKADVKNQDDEDEEETAGTRWMAHILKCEMSMSQVKDANIKDADTYSIYDPRNPMNKRRREEGKKKSKERK